MIADDATDSTSKTAAAPDPETTRRPGVRGWPVVLADGRAWTLAYPVPRLRPRFLPMPDDDPRNPPMLVELDRHVCYPPRVQAAADRFAAIIDRPADDPGPAPSEADEVRATVQALAAILPLAHRVGPGELAELLALDGPGVREAALAAYRAIGRYEPEGDDAPTDAPPDDPAGPQPEGSFESEATQKVPIE